MEDNKNWKTCYCCDMQGFYTSTGQAQRISGRKTFKEGDYILPARATFNPLPPATKGKIARFIKGAWLLQDTDFGKQIYDSQTTAFKVVSHHNKLKPTEHLIKTVQDDFIELENGKKVIKDWQGKFLFEEEQTKEPVEHYNERMRVERAAAYAQETDPLIGQYIAGDISKEEYIAARQKIKEKYPYKTEK